MIILRTNKIILILLTVFLAFPLNSAAYGQELDSNNYTIMDASIGSSADISESSSYSLLQTIDPLKDIRLTSGSYSINATSTDTFKASIPLVNCFETNTTSETTTCINFPNSNGAQGECGQPGCYNRAKLEIDDQSNPIDTLYLVKITDISNSNTYYLQSDHTISATYDINDFLDQCTIEGKDDDSTSCDDAGDQNWDTDLQRYNIFGLTDNTQYEISVSALHGDFNGTPFSPVSTATTEATSLTFDIDISNIDEETSAPYDVALGDLIPGTVTTAINQIWVNLGTNASNGANVYIRDTNSKLYSSSTQEEIPSESEDLSLDLNSNGGYGVKIVTSETNQSALGPLQEASGYSTISVHEVGALTASNSLIFFTDTTGSNSGPIAGGRGSIYIKALSINIDSASQDFTDNIIFIAVSNF